MKTNNKLHHYLLAIIGATCLQLTGCGTPPAEEEDKSTKSKESTEQKDTVKAFEHVTCEAPKDMTLTDIQSAVEWINALPKPTTLPCLVESLPRPLYVNMNTSTFSAQPSISELDPRIFIFYDNLTISVVTDHNEDNVTDDGSEFNLLEMSVLTADINDVPENDDILSIKGELVFPVTETVLPEAPHQRVVLDFTDAVSGCGLCHSRASKLDETIGESKTPLFQSVALKPFEEQDFLLDTLYEEYDKCESSTESYRCAMMSALLDHGAVLEQDFPERMIEFGSSAWRKGAR